MRNKFEVTNQINYNATKLTSNQAENELKLLTRPENELLIMPRTKSLMGPKKEVTN